MWKPHLITKPSDPLLSTREVDLFFAIGWALFATWGYLSVIHGTPTITMALGPVFNFLWALAIAGLSTVASLAAVLLFFKTKMKQLTKMRIEAIASMGLAPLFLIYPVYLGFRSITDDNSVLWSSTVISITYALIALFRARHLKYRIKYYAKSAK